MSADHAAHWRGPLYPTGTSIVVAAPASHANDGSYPLSCYSVDAAGSVETTKSVTVRIDTVGPTTSGKAASGLHRHAVTLRYFVSDKLSPKATSVVLVVKNRRGKVAKSFSLGAKTARVW